MKQFHPNGWGNKAGVNRCYLPAHGLNDPDNDNGVTTHLEPDILECEVKWALGSITMNKLVEMMEFQLHCFKS